VTVFVLASVRPAPPVESGRPRLDSREFWLESWDGSVKLPIARERHRGSIRLLTGGAGYEVAPSELALSSVPGAAGAVVTGVHTRPRDVLLPLQVHGRNQAAVWAEVQKLRDLTDPERGMTRDGNFRLVCRSASGTRQLSLAYRSGLEDAVEDLPWMKEYVLDCLAPQPFPQDREEQSKPFLLASGNAGFLGAPWPPKLSSSAVMGAGTPVEMLSTVPVYVTAALTGPCDSVLIEGSNGLRLDVPGGVPAGKTLRIVTDRRRKSIRLDGAPAAGMLAMGSKAPPFPLGQTLLSVTATGATAATRLVLSWLGLHRSLY